MVNGRGKETFIGNSVVWSHLCLAIITDLRRTVKGQGGIACGKIQGETLGIRASASLFVECGGHFRLQDNVDMWV